MLEKNETTMHFKGHHADKIRMAYKAQGDGLQIDTLLQKGYTYQIFMYNDPVSNCFNLKVYSHLLG